MDSQLPSTLIVPIIIFCIALSFRSILSFLETTITALRLFKLKEMAQVYTRYAGLLYFLKHNPHRVLITILVANSIADVLCAALATQIANTIFSYFNLSTSMGFSIGIGVASLTIIVFGEIMPKNVARVLGERAFPSMLWFTNAIFYLLYPLVSLLTYFTNAFMYRLGGINPTDTPESITSEDEIRFLIEYIHERGLIEPEKSEMLQNIFELGGTQVKEIMVSAIDIISVSNENTIAHVLEIFSKYRYTRLPVYKSNKDNIIGMVHLKDLFTMSYRHEQKMVKDIVRPIMFVPETLKINQLLREFRHQRNHIAIVLNEHGIVTGLVTLEDILEEIVGEISDEHELITAKIVKIKDGRWLADGSIPVEDLEKKLAVKLSNRDSTTLSGFLAEQLQHMPKKGDRIVHNHYSFQIQKANNRRATQVLIVDTTRDSSKKL